MRIACAVAALAIAISIYSGFASASSDAPPAGATILWVRADGAESCPDTQSLERSIAARLGRDASAGLHTQSIEAVVSHTGATWVARMFVRDSTGALIGGREFHSESLDCATIATAVALAMAIAVDPDAALRPMASSASPSPSPSPTELQPRSSQSSAPVTSANRPGFSREMASVVRVVVASGLLPGAALGLAIRTDLTLASRWTAMLDGLWFPEVGAQDRRYQFGLSAIGLSGCFAPIATTVVHIGLCAGVMAGSLHAVVFAPQPVDAGDHAWVALTGSIRVRFHIVGPLILDLGIDALTPLVHYQFVALTPLTPVYQEDPVALVGSIGVGLSFR